jgi:hypothetical protein
MSPEDPEDPKVKARRERLAREHQEIISGVGSVTRAWAQLESTLFQIFQLLARLDVSWAQQIAGVIFYTPSNTETRISLVDNLISYHCQLHRSGPIDDRLVELWDKKIKGKINNIKNTRNAIVHGGIILSALGVDDQHQRLSPMFGDTLRIYPQIKSGRHPGLGANELHVHEQAVWRVNERTLRLAGLHPVRLTAS